MSKKLALIIFIISFSLGILYKLAPLALNGLSVSKDIVLQEDKTYTIAKTLKSGCYEVGFYSNDKLFFSSMYEPFKFTSSNFKLTLLNKSGKILKEVDIDTNSRLQHGFSAGGIKGESSNVALELFKVPFKGSSDIKANIYIKKLNDKYKDKKVQIYFKKYASSCDIENLKAVVNGYAYPINKQETNSTLKPLFKALTNKNTLKVKDILDNNQSLCGSNFIGNRTVFTYSAFLNDLDTLSYLIDKCGTKRLHEEDILKRSPLVYALEHNSTKVLDLLFENGGKCPEVLTNEYIKTYVGAGITYKKEGVLKPGSKVGLRYRYLEEFLVEYNLPSVAEVLAKNECINVDRIFKGFSGYQTWTEWMEDDMMGTQQMKDDNDSGWKLQKDYTELIKVFKKYSKKHKQF